MMSQSAGGRFEWYQNNILAFNISETKELIVDCRSGMVGIYEDVLWREAQHYVPRHAYL